MKKTVTRNAATALAVLLTVSGGIGCGFVASVPWIRNAQVNKVVNLGDSIFALSGEIQDYLHSYGGKTFRRYATSGAELKGGDLIAPSVVNQYATARADNSNIQTVLMDGGGNDILLPVLTLFDIHNCKKDWWESSLSTSCKNLINDIYVDGVNLLNDMRARGVQKVIYVGYYYTKDSLISGNLSALRQAIDYGDAKFATACANSLLSCTFIDPRSKIVNSDIIADGIHPATSGSQKIANLIWPHLAPRLL
jgi:hypothetical protein